MATLGDKLKAARERMGATTSQAAAATRIMVQHIEAMEAGQFHRIPAPTYAKGFIRMYADYLGLDPVPLVREYVEEHMPRTKAKLSPPETESRRRPAAPGRAPGKGAGEPATPRSAPVDSGRAWRAWAAALAQAWQGFRPALARIPWKPVAAAVLLLLVVAALRSILGARAQKRQGPVVVDFAAAARIPVDVPAVIREPPEPYLESGPPGRRTP